MAVQTPTWQSIEMASTGISVRVPKNQLPVGVGTYLLMQVDTLAAPVVNVPTGWNQYFATANGVICKQTVFWKVATAADTLVGDYLLTFSVAATARITLHAINGVDTTDPSSFARSSVSGTNTAPTASSVTTPAPNCLVIHMVGIVNNSSVTHPSTFTEMADTSALVGTNSIRGESSYKLFASQGATGAMAASVSTSAAWVATAIALPSTDYPMLRGATTATTTTSGIAAPVKVAGTATGDRLLAYVKSDSPSTPLTVPPGFTLVPGTETASGASLKTWVFEKRVTNAALEPATYGFTRVPASGYLAVALVAVVSAQQSGDLKGGVSSVATPSSTTHATSVTTLYANSMVFGAFAEAGNNAGTTLFTAPSGMTERVDIQLIGIADTLQLVAGPSGTKTGTFTVAGVGTATLLEMRPNPPLSRPGPQWNTNNYWGLGVYLHNPAQWDTNLYWGLGTYGLTTTAPSGTSLMMLMGVG